MRRPQVLEQRTSTRVQLYQGQQEWSQGKAAMTITAGSDVKKFVTQVGVEKVGVMAMPKWGAGRTPASSARPRRRSASPRGRSTPRWTPNFIMFMHTPSRLAAWFKATGDLPGRRPVQHEADHAAAAEGAVRPREATASPYLENFIPTELDSEGNFAEAQLLLGGQDRRAAGGRQVPADRDADPDHRRQGDRQLRALGEVRRRLMERPARNETAAHRPRQRVPRPCPLRPEAPPGGGAPGAPRSPPGGHPAGPVAPALGRRRLDAPRSRSSRSSSATRWSSSYASR